MEEKTKVTSEQARQELDKWLDKKMIPQRRRDELVGSYENIIEAIVYGHINIDENNLLTQNLVFPDQAGIDKLIYKERITDLDREPHRRTVKDTSFQGELKVTIMAATGCMFNNIRKMDTVADLGLAESIAVFFV